MQNTEQTMSKNIFLKLGSELVLGLLVALLSVLTALSAYQSSLADSKEADLNVEGQKLLTDSNSLYLETNQFVIYDYTMYDGWYVNEGKDDEAAQYYYENFSESLTASMERESGPFDDQYYQEMYVEAETAYDEAMTRFEEAQEAGDTADQLQLAVLIFAVGLALSAYASMLAETSKLRVLFAIGAILGLLFGLVIFFSA